MKALKASILLFAMLLAACEGLKSPTELESVEGTAEQTWPVDDRRPIDKPK